MGGWRGGLAKGRQGWTQDVVGGGGFTSYHGKAIPLPSNLISRVAVAVWVVVDGFFVIYCSPPTEHARQELAFEMNECQEFRHTSHILLARAAGVEVDDVLDDGFVLRGDGDALLRVGLVVDVFAHAVWVAVSGQCLGVGGGFVEAVDVLRGFGHVGGFGQVLEAVTVSHWICSQGAWKLEGVKLKPLIY